MEIMGLMIVVILVILGILFGMKVISKPTSDIEAEFKAKSMSVNYLNTLLGTTTDCKRGTFRELIQDCAQGGTLSCEVEEVGFLMSCDYVNYHITSILNSSLGVMKKNYHMHLEGPGSTVDIEVKNPPGKTPCPGVRSRGTQYIPSRKGTITINLDICEP